MITEKFAQTLKTKIAIKNFDRRSEPEMKKQLYKLIEEELAKIKEEEKKKDNIIKELKSKVKEERKNTCEEIREKIIEMTGCSVEELKESLYDLNPKDIFDILDQIEKGE